MIHFKGSRQPCRASEQSQHALWSSFLGQSDINWLLRRVSTQLEEFSVLSFRPRSAWAGDGCCAGARALKLRLRSQHPEEARAEARVSSVEARGKPGHRVWLVNCQIERSTYQNHRDKNHGVLGRSLVPFSVSDKGACCKGRISLYSWLWKRKPPQENPRH